MAGRRSSHPGPSRPAHPSRHGHPGRNRRAPGPQPPRPPVPPRPIQPPIMQHRLTLYPLPRCSAAAGVFTHDVRNLRAAGMNDRALDLVAGGRRQVCESANYRGRCKVVTGRCQICRVMVWAGRSRPSVAWGGDRNWGKVMTVRRIMQAGIAAPLVLTPVAAVPERAGPQAPGTLISAEPMSGARRASLARPLSLSRSAAGRRRMTGVVISAARRGAGRRAPRHRLGTRHLRGVAEKCAPSTGNFFGATPGRTNACARLRLMATIMPGSAAAADPIWVGASAAHSMLVRCAPRARVSGARTRIVLCGLGQIPGRACRAVRGRTGARDYAPELKLVGIAAAAPPTDLIANLTGRTDPSVRAFLTAFTAGSWSRHFRHSPVDDLSTDAPRAAVEQLAQELPDDRQEAEAGHGGRHSRLAPRPARRRSGQIQPWARIARENSAGQHAPGGPLVSRRTARDVIVSPTASTRPPRRLRITRMRLLAT